MALGCSARGTSSVQAVQVASLGFRTDLALLERAGSTVEDRGDHLVVRSPYNPSFYRGNFLLLDHVPGADRVGEWLDRFAVALPDTRHRAFGFDGYRDTVDDLKGPVGTARIELATSRPQTERATRLRHVPSTTV